ncbi:hypothetical protein BDV96DRAFT_691898 [Lophiotrema nucula]|uniref:Uncharacterized protein n=1 Tax=Lophiotrema nucula TaxID=690887 RepID=A0A6A5YTQ6_9PLEO|nr:hypothetical protein BDV96DRAFT_691898 [Lophiotrema nucula]
MELDLNKRKKDYPTTEVKKSLTTEDKQMLDRAKALKGCEKQMSGLYKFEDTLSNRNRDTEDPKLPEQALTWIEEGKTMCKKLWIEFPKSQHPKHIPNAAKTFALLMASTLDKEKATCIKGFAEQPLPSDWLAGLHSLLYQLMVHTLKITPQGNDTFIIEDFAIFQLGKQTWRREGAMTILKAALDTTPEVRYCILSGLDEIEDGGAGQHCENLVRMLLSQFDSRDLPLSFLFVTNGPSEVLTLALEEFKNKGLEHLVLPPGTEDMFGDHDSGDQSSPVVSLMSRLKDMLG